MVEVVRVGGGDIEGEDFRGHHAQVDSKGRVYVKVTDGTDEVAINTDGSLNTTQVFQTGTSGDPILEISKGNISGHSVINKFGNAPDFDTGDGEVTIWDGANDGGINAMSYTYSATANIGILSSSNAGDTQTVEVQGLDSNYDENTTTYTLNGQTDVDMSATGTDLIRVFRMKITSSSDNAGDVYIRTNGSGQTNGVPDTANTVRAVIRAGQNQTLMAVYTVPNAKTAYMTAWYAFTAGANKSADFDILLRARPDGEVFQVKHYSTINDVAQVGIQHLYVPYNKFLAKTDLEMRCDITTVGITAAGISAGFDLILVDD